MKNEIDTLSILFVKLTSTARAHIFAPVIQTGVFDKGISDAAITAVAHIKRLLKDNFVKNQGCTQNGNVFWQFTHVFCPC